jgi:hypothetical protein
MRCERIALPSELHPHAKKHSKPSSEDFNSYFQHEGAKAVKSKTNLPWPLFNKEGEKKHKEWSAQWPTLQRREPRERKRNERGGFWVSTLCSLLCALRSMLFASLSDFHMQGFGLFAAQNSDGVGVSVSELLIEGDRIFEGADLLAVHTSDHIPVFKAH